MNFFGPNLKSMELFIASCLDLLNKVEKETLMILVYLISCYCIHLLTKEKNCETDNIFGIEGITAQMVDSTIRGTLS